MLRFKAGERPECRMEPSPLYLPYISPISPLYLPYISRFKVGERLECRMEAEGYEKSW